MKKRFIAYAIFFTLLGGYTIFMYVDDSSGQEVLEQVNANQPKLNHFYSNIDKIKSGEIKVQNYIYPTYIPDGYVNDFDSITITEDSKYYDETYKSTKLESLNFDLKDSLYKNIFIYKKTFKEENTENKIFILMDQDYVDSKDIYKKDPNVKTVVTLENFQNDRISYDKKDLLIKIKEQKELNTQDTIFDKIFFETINGDEEMINLYLFKKIEPIGECDYLMINITSNTTFERDPNLINLEEIEKIIKGLKTS